MVGFINEVEAMRIEKYHPIRFSRKLLITEIINNRAKVVWIVDNI